MGVCVCEGIHIYATSSAYSHRRTKLCKPYHAKMTRNMKWKHAKRGERRAKQGKLTGFKKRRQCTMKDDTVQPRAVPSCRLILCAQTRLAATIKVGQNWLFSIPWFVSTFHVHAMSFSRIEATHAHNKTNCNASCSYCRCTGEESKTPHATHTHTSWCFNF